MTWIEKPFIIQSTKMQRHSASDLEILVVDDEPMVREVVVGNLAEKFPTFRIRQAASGNAALAMINERVPDLILADLRMPGLNGFAMTRLLRSRDRTRHLPIIVISGLKDTGSVLKALELGATDYCVKPIDFELLVRKIEIIAARLLNLPDLAKRNRSSPRRRLQCPSASIMTVAYPEREGLWIDSPLDIGEGEPILVDGSHFFEALRLKQDKPTWWTRVEHCRKEADQYQVKLLLDPIPQKYDEQLLILNRSKDRFRRYFTNGQEPIVLEFPCMIQNLSGGGVLVGGTLPWKAGSLVTLNLTELIHRLGLNTNETRGLAMVRWAKKSGYQYQAGLRFETIDEDLRLQIMSYCLRGAPAPSALKMADKV